MQFVDLQAQYKTYQAEIDGRIRTVLGHGHFIMGPEIVELEQVLASYVGVKHCITVASGTASLEIALRALGVGPGDEVVTVPFTWISSAKAIPPVSLFGQMPDYHRINAIAARHDLPVIEDAAQSFGASQGGKRSCGVTLIGSTSFFPAKPLGCYGDGGALFTNDDALAEKMRAIRTHGGQKRHHHPFLGMNGRFDTLQAAVLFAKFPHFEWEVQERARIGARYTELLSSVFRPPSSVLRPPSSAPAVVPGNTHVYAQYTIRVPNRDTVGEKLKTQGIPTAVYYPKCLH